MKNMLFACFLCSTTLATAQDNCVDPLPAPVFRGIFHDDVTLNAGTIILLETTEAIQSAQMTVGRTLQFKVRTNVVADGKTAVRTGAMALGRVKAIQSGTHNNPGEIRIELLYAQAVDGQMIPLNGNEQSMRGQFAGQDVGVEPGRPITAHVTNTVEIEME